MKKKKSKGSALSKLKSKGALRSIERRVRRSYQEKDIGAFNAKTIIDPAKCDLPQFRPRTSGVNLIDFVPYLAGKNDPKTPEGEVTYVFDVFIHTLGSSRDRWICLEKLAGKPCKACKYRERNRDVLSESEFKALVPKRYTVYGVVDRKDPEKKLQIWEVAHFFMEKDIQAIAKDPEEDTCIPFSDYSKEHGKSIAFEMNKTKEGVQYYGHKFVNRKANVPDEILEAMPTLDEVAHIPTPKEFTAAFDAIMKEGVGEPEEEPEDIEDEDYDIDEDVDEDVEEEEEEEDDEQEEEEEEEEEEETCPGGGEFGSDINRLEHCAECEVWDECAEEAERLRPKKKKKKVATKKKGKLSRLKGK